MNLKIMNKKILINKINFAKKNKEIIVMTNGCFDILHVGHVKYLEEAKKLGNRLIVAVNSDKSVKLLKGKKRPINSLKNRIAVLKALKSIDWVISFNEKTPEKLIKNILPDVLVKGGDYNITNIVGKDVVLKNGGKVLTLNFEVGVSTTKIIKNFFLIKNI